MAAEHWSILFKKHLVWTDTMDWQCHLPTKGCNGQSEMGVWGAVPSANISTPPPPQSGPKHSQKNKTKQNTKQTLLAHIWGNKLETNKSKWALRLSTSSFLQSMFPDGNSLPSLTYGVPCFFPDPLLWAQMDSGVQLGPQGWGLPSGPSRLH